MRGALAACLVISCGGCGLLLDPEPPAQRSVADAGYVEADTGAVIDAAIVSDALVGPTDARTPGYCTQSSDDKTVALYAFDEMPPLGELWDSSPGLNHGFDFTGDMRVDGPSGCDRALRLDGLNMHHGRVDATSEHRLMGGAFDFWMFVDSDAPTSTMGVVSRDAFGNGEGHMTVWLGEEQHLVARFQVQDDPSGNYAFLCSTVPIERDVWVHVGVNFGDPSAELFIDGSYNTAPSRAISVILRGEVAAEIPCTNDMVRAQATLDTDQAWIFGASAANSDPGDERLERFFHGAIDSFRLSSSRRTFADVSP